MKENLGVILILAITFTLFACTQPANEEQAVPEQVAETVVGKITSDQYPNVVFILVDDLGFGDVGYNGSDIATPVLDQMAIDGVMLNRNYVYPVCSPTRAALLTGHNPLIHGVDAPLSIKEALPTDIQIMPEYFKQLGYQTFMVGKWHLGLGNTDYWPTSRGFDSHYGFLGGWVDFYTHVHAGGLDWQREGQTVREEGHATDLLTAEALRVIESRDQDKPFLLYMAYNAPHSPLQTTPVNSGLNDDIEIRDRRVYAEMVTQTDAGIGQLMDILEVEGILEKTIIVFSSDNGGSLHWGASNGALNGQKGATMEGGIRVPGLVSWPDHVQGGRVLEQPIMVYDWLPTLLDAVGGDASVLHDAQGQSMWSAIVDDVQVAPKVMVFGGRDHRAVIDWPWKLVRLEADGVRQNIQLFNIVDDPNEQNDLAAQYPEKISVLLAALNAVPIVASKGASSGNSTASFYTTGDNKDYEARLGESLEPWAEAAIRGSD